MPPNNADSMQAAGQLQEINCSGLAACCQHPPASSASLSQTHSWAPRSLGVRGRHSTSHIVQEVLLAAQCWGAGHTEQRWAGSPWSRSAATLSQGLQVSPIPACCPTEEPLPGLLMLQGCNSSIPFQPSCPLLGCPLLFHSDPISCQTLGELE